MTKKKKPDPIEAIEKALEAIPDTKLPDANLSLGTDLFDLAVSGKIGAAMGPGRYIWYRGDSGSGKSFLTLALLAEAAKSPYYADYRLIYIDQELGASFDIAQFFGKKAASRIERVENIKSLERFYDQMDAWMKQGPIIAVLDSFDALPPEAYTKNIEENAKKRAEGKEIDGTYAMDHAKIHSQRLRRMVIGLGDSKSIFVGISQLRDNVGGGIYAPKNKISGGRALKFYSSVAVDTKFAGSIKKKIRDVEREIGHYVKLEIDKNRISGKNREVEVPFLPGYGIDNVGASLDWLVKEKYLTNSGGRIAFPGYDAAYYREELIRRIEDDEREGDLRNLLQESWNDLESLMAMPRKNRYE